MSRFDFSQSLEALLATLATLRDPTQQQYETELAELELVLDILDTPAWTAQDCAARKDRCEWEILCRRLVSSTDPNIDSFRVYGLDDSAFWFCVQKAKRQALSCLTTRGPTGIPGVLANTADRGFHPVPGVEGQLLIAFDLVTLLYATFMIPVPARGTTPLWTQLITVDPGAHQRGIQDATPEMPTFQCLDLTPVPTHDRHSLKQTLRQDRFTMGRPASGRYPVVMPWPDVLRELVGYTKYAQSLMPDPVSQPLVEMRRLVARDAARLRELLAHPTNDAIVTLLKSVEVAQPTEDTAPVEDATHTTHMLARMHSVINT
jgi:hypothetical protein